MRSSGLVRKRHGCEVAREGHGQVLLGGESGPLGALLWPESQRLASEAAKSNAKR